MSYKNLLVDQTENIITITLNRPKALNALSKDMMIELEDFFSKTYEGVTGIIIHGSGEKAFAAGADITQFTSFDEKDGSAMAGRGHNIFFSIEEYSVPVIAVIDGYTLGAGCELAMACHMRICTHKSKFGQPEVNLGLVPGYGGSQRLIQYIGKTKAIELLMTGDMIDADQAEKWGLINYTFETKTEALEKAYSLLKKISRKGPLAIKKIIELVNANFEHEKVAFAKEVRDFGHLMGTEDSNEGATAFMEKRRADFKGK